MSGKIISDDALDIIFRTARSFKHWSPEPVSDAQLQAVYELAKFGPTSLNSQPMRLTFVRSAEAKAKLAPCLDAANVERMITAPATAIIAYDPQFYTRGDNPRLAGFAARDNHDHLLRNSSLGGAYVIMAARALGLDSLPMSGFNHDAVDAAFYSDTGYKSNFLLALGHGDHARLTPRGPRLAFDDACEIV